MHFIILLIMATGAAALLISRAIASCCSMKHGDCFATPRLHVSLALYKPLQAGDICIASRIAADLSHWTPPMLRAHLVSMQVPAIRPCLKTFGSKRGVEDGNVLRCRTSDTYHLLLCPSFGMHTCCSERMAKVWCVGGLRMITLYFEVA